MKQVSREITKLSSGLLLRQDRSHHRWIWLGVIAAALVVGDGLGRTVQAQKREDPSRPATPLQEPYKAYVIRGYILHTSFDEAEYTVIGEDEELWLIRHDDILARQDWQGSVQDDIPGQPIQLTLKPGATLKNIVFVPSPTAQMCQCAMQCEYGYCCAKKIVGVLLEPRCGTRVCKVKFKRCRP
jgi:hypothetical protein